MNPSLSSVHLGLGPFENVVSTDCGLETSTLVLRVFVAGASGVIGVRLVPQLVVAGHEVAGMTRSPAKVELLRGLGAEPVVCDAFDAHALREAVGAFQPEAVVNELTDLPDQPAATNDANARMRREGTRNLLAAAKEAGASRFVAQSIAWQLPGDAGAAVSELERLVLAADGVVLRYGRLYGPGTDYEDEKPEPPRVHVDEAARRTVPALDAAFGIIDVTDD
jgi:nucleoside-diphosphate-sugar epimerase